MVKRFLYYLVGLIAVFTIAGASTAMSDKSDARGGVRSDRRWSRRRSTRASPPTRRRPTSSPT